MSDVDTNMFVSDDAFAMPVSHSTYSHVDSRPKGKGVCTWESLMTDVWQ